jgi:hypothetical protein
MFSGHPRTSDTHTRRRTGRLLCTGSLLGVAAVTAAACSAGTTVMPLTAKQVLRLASRDAQRVTSAVETLRINVNGAPVTSGTVRFSLKPAFEADAMITVTQAGQAIPIREIITRNALYFKIAGLTKLTHKPWVKVTFAELSGTAGAGLAGLVHSIQSSSFANQAQLFTTASHARKVGPATVNGVATTEYAGSMTAATALARLSPALRKLFGPGLKLLGTEPIRFRVWIDRQHRPIREIVLETISGQQVSTTVDLTSINQPVSIMLPPASQVAVPPPGAFAGGGSGGGGAPPAG